MKTLKKTLCLVLAVVMAVGVLVLPASADYKDVASDNKYVTAINTLTAYGILKGKSTTEQVFDPTGNVTRAEVAAIAYRILTGDTSDAKKGNYVDYTKVFKDTFADWQKGYVGLCANDGIIYGKGNGYFKPDDNVTGYELLAIMLRAIGYGKNGEFQGANWQKNTLYQAEQLNLLKGVKYDMAKDLTREVVAQIVLNSIRAPRVTYVNGTYSFVKDPRDPASNVNIPLVQEASVVVTGEQDVWGIPTNYSTSTTITFTNPAISVPVKEIGKTNTYPAYSTFDAITECNLIKALGDDGNHWAVTYTNGKYNETVTEIEALDTTHKIGHEGRHTLVYKNPSFTGVESAKNPKYIIVYIDTFLAVVDRTWSEARDPANHVIRKAGATVKVYFNNWPDQSGIKTDGSSPAYLTVDGTYAVGDKLGVNVVTVSKRNSAATKPYKVSDYSLFNSINGTNAVITPNKSFKATKNADGEDTWPAGAQIVADPTVATSPYALTKATVTIDTVTKDTVDMGAMKNEYSVGFTYAGKQYFYNNTFAGTVINNTGIGKTYDVWLDSEGNVLDLAISTVSAGYGVTRNIVLKQINSKAWVLTYTILLPDGTETTIDVGDPASQGKAFSSEGAAKSYAARMPEDTLVHYVNSLSYYWFDQTNWAPAPARVGAIESGRANAVTRPYNTDANCITGTYPGLPDKRGWVVDDNTVFFVAQYLPDLTTDTENDWTFTGYKIYTGFKTIYDLYSDESSTTAIIDGRTFNGLEIQAFDVDINGNAILKTDDKPAKYVLVLGATKQIDPPKYVDEINYAYLITKDVHTQVGANTYTYTAIIDGETTTLTVALNRGAVINKTGLYSYAQNVNGQGYAQVYRLDGDQNNNPNMKDPYKRDFEITKKNYYYEAGVLYTYDKTWNYTVDDNCKVYLVNQTTGTVLERDLSALDIYGEVSSIWYQLNEKGYIDLIYIEEQEINSQNGMIPDVKPETPATEPSTIGVTSFEGLGSKWIAVGTTDSTKTVSDKLAAVSAYLAKKYPGYTITVTNTDGAYTAKAVKTSGGVTETFNWTIDMNGAPVSYRNPKTGENEVIGAIGGGDASIGYFLVDSGRYTEKELADLSGYVIRKGSMGFFAAGTLGYKNGQYIYANTPSTIVVGTAKEPAKLPVSKDPITLGNVTGDIDANGNDVVVTGTVTGTISGAKSISGTATVTGNVSAETVSGQVTVGKGGSLEAETVEKNGKITVNDASASVTVDEVAEGGTITASAGTVNVEGTVSGTVTVSDAADVSAGDIGDGGSVKAESSSTGTVTVGDVLKGGKLEVEGGNVTAGTIAGEATVAAGKKLTADKIEKGAELKVDVASKIECDNWAEAANFSSSSPNTVATSNICDMSVGIYENDGNDLDSTGQTNHRYILRYDFEPTDVHGTDHETAKIVVAVTVNGKTGYDVKGAGGDYSEMASYHHVAVRFCPQDFEGIEKPKTGDTVSVKVFWTTGSSEKDYESKALDYIEPLFEGSFTYDAAGESYAH